MLHVNHNGILSKDKIGIEPMPPSKDASPLTMMDSTTELLALNDQRHLFAKAKNVGAHNPTKIPKRSP